MPEKPFEYRKGQGNAGFSWISLTASTDDAERQRLIASLTTGQPDHHIRYFIKAWDAVKQRLVWQVDTVSWNGVMTTAGGLVFHGRSDGQLLVLDAHTGAELHSIEVGQNMASAPMSYKVDGEQYVAIMADDAKDIFDGSALESAGENGRIIAFKLGGGEVPKQAPHTARTGKPGPPPIERFGTSEQITLGRKLFERHCMVCHADGARAPDLTRMSADTHASFLGVVIEGLRSDRGMVSFRSQLSKDAAQAIHAYLTDLAWENYQRHSSSSPVPEETQK
jgi:quinohemoprotein ethanol dehydrogenase